MTEGNTQTVLHNESLDEIVTVLRCTSLPQYEEEQAEQHDIIANTIEAQR